MRILLISLDFQPNRLGGVGLFQHNLCLAMHQFGHLIDVLSPFITGCVDIDARLPYRVFRFRLRQHLSSFVTLMQILALHREHHYDVIFIGHFITTHGLGALVLRRLWGVPYVILSHGNDLRYSIGTMADELVARFLLRNTALMLANSHFTAQRIRQAGYDGPVEILHPGVDVERFKPNIDPSALCQGYSLGRRRVLITTARFTPKKNIDGVFRALPQVIEQIPEVLYLVVGCAYQDRNEEIRLLNLVKELAVERYVQFVGEVENQSLPPFYCAAELFVMPSYEVEESGDIETFGISYVEANACGLPVIGGRSGGTADAVIDGKTGLLVDPYDVDEIAAAIIRLLTDRELAWRLGENGRQRVEQELTWEKVGDRLEGYLKQVQKKR